MKSENGIKLPFWVHQRYTVINFEPAFQISYFLFGNVIVTEIRSALLSVINKVKLLTCFACMCFNRWGQCGTILAVLMVERLFGHNGHSAGNNKMISHVC